MRPQTAKPRILITGASGFLGASLCREAQAKWEVSGIHHTRPMAIDGVHPVQADLCSLPDLRKIFARIDPAAVIHAAAISRPDHCEAHARETRRINVDVPWFLADLCAAKNILLAFTSTDLVFDGRQAPYDEKAAPNPVNIYGSQKLAAEQGILSAYPQAAVCRLPLLFGLNSGGGGFEAKVLEDLRAGRKVKLFTDEYRTPVDTVSAARGILRALTRVHGLIHLGGRIRLSRYEMGLKLAQLSRTPTRLIEPVQAQKMSLSTPRPADVSLDSRRAYSLGYAPTRLEEAMKEMMGNAGFGSLRL